MIELLLICVVIVLAFLVVELKNIMHAAICLGGMCTGIGMLFAILNAMYVMAFQLLIYVGATMVFFLSVIMLTERNEK